MGSEIFDVVIHKGRIIDPGSGVDAVRSIGIHGHKIKKISPGRLDGKLLVDATGRIVTPGWIEISPLVQSTNREWQQAFNGVTSILEISPEEISTHKWYDQQAVFGRVLNYGILENSTFQKLFDQDQMLCNHEEHKVNWKNVDSFDWEIIPNQTSAAKESNIRSVRSDNYDLSSSGQIGKFFSFIEENIKPQGHMSLLEVIQCCSLIPAKRLEPYFPAFRSKGHLQAGADADLLIISFESNEDHDNPEEQVLSRFQLQTLFVNGTMVIQDQGLDILTFPGRPIWPDAT